jgi:hypothetical protein
MFMELSRLVIGCGPDATETGAIKTTTDGIALTGPEKRNL